MTTPAARLRALLERPGIRVTPSCFDAHSAKLIERAGFELSFMSGFAVSAARIGEPDTGLISYAEMLDQAAAKGVYAELIEADLTVGMEVADDTYAGVTSAGTFTHGHLPPEPLGELIRISMPGARCAIGINAAHWSDHGFEAYLDGAVADGRIEPYEITVVKVYEGSDPANPDDMSNVVSFTVR